MYAAVGSYLVRVHRLFDLRFARYPRRWITAFVALGIYVNFFSHHVLHDARWGVMALVLVVWWRCMMHFRMFRRTLRMPVLLAFGLVAGFIWAAENLATWSNAWAYPDQLEGWQLVSVAKLGSWFLLMIISLVLVTWMYPPEPPDATAVLEASRFFRSPRRSRASRPGRWNLRTSSDHPAARARTASMVSASAAVLSDR